MFDNFWFIFLNIILPIIFQILVGFMVQKRLRLDIKSLSKLQFLVFTPAMLFIKIYQGELSGGLVAKVIAACLVIYVIMVLISYGVCLLARFKGGIKNAFANTTTLYNSGNYCIPLMQLLYNNDPFVMSVQAVIVTLQNILVAIFGTLNASSGKSGAKKALFDVLKLPMIYVTILAAVFKLFHIELWSPVVSTLNIMSSGLVPTALFILGAQLAESKINFSDFKVYLSSFLKLAVAPVVAFFVIKAFGITGLAAPVIMIVSGAPSAANVLILSVQFDNEPDFTGQAVFTSTVLSAITVTILIYFTKVYTGF